MSDYKKILFTYFDPNNSFWKTTQKDQARYSIYYCCNSGYCDAYKNGCCVLRNGIGSGKCPYGKIITNSGPTKRAKSCYEFIEDAKKENEDIISAHLTNYDGLGEIGDYIYLNLSFLDNYVNPIAEELEIVRERFLPKESFTPETIVRILKYRPQALFGGVITSYEKENLPKFVMSLQRNYPDLYKKVFELYPDVAQYVIPEFYIGKKAFVKTLSPGRVKVGIHYWDWDGTQLNGTGKEVNTDFKDEKVTVIPTDKTVAVICEEKTVNDKTKFVSG